ncbi:MAG: sigma 54-interacting transcriptional regulator [Pseudomonadota bacterium]
MAGSRGSRSRAEPDLAAMIDAMPLPAILLDREYRILFANRRYRERYGWSDGGPRKCYQVSHRNEVPCDLAGETCPIRDCLTNGRPTEVLHVHHTPRGEEHVRVEMWPLRAPGTDTITHFVELLHPSSFSGESDAEGVSHLVGKAPRFLHMMGLLERVAPSSTNVMLLGESGTGKEMVANALHQLSPRKDQPFVTVECTGLPESLFESELFGHVRGSFTGATSDKPGLVTAADGGTLFLDEVGEIPLPSQVKLLRLLETRRYRRLGDTEWQQSDFRLVSATNKHLREMVAEGLFREDLYYRLSVFEIDLPALRDRIEDLPLLVGNLLQRLGYAHLSVSKEALQALTGYRFPGNVRELRNIIERAALLTDSDRIEVSHLPQHCLEGAPGDGRHLQGAAGWRWGDGIRPLAEIEAEYLEDAARRHQGSRKELAATLGLSERALYRRLQLLRIRE